MQNKTKIIKPDKCLLYTFRKHTYFLCTVHVILNKITKANNLAFSHHVLLWPCVRTGRPTFRWCLIVTPTPYWTVLWYFSNILVGCNLLKKHALNMGHKKNLCSRGLNTELSVCISVHAHWQINILKVHDHSLNLNYRDCTYVPNILK